MSRVPQISDIIQKFNIHNELRWKISPSGVRWRRRVHGWVSRIRLWLCSGKNWHTAYFTPNILNYYIKRCCERFFCNTTHKMLVKQASWEVTKLDSRISANYKSSLPVSHFGRWVCWRVGKLCFIYLFLK